MHIPRCKAKSGWRSVDAHFDDIVEMLLPPLLYWKAADSSIMTYCTRTAYWMFHDAMPNILDAPLTLILTMWQRASDLLFSQ